MAARKLNAEDLTHIQELAKGWGKIIVRQHWGEKGPGLDVDLDPDGRCRDGGCACFAGRNLGSGDSAAGRSTGSRTSLSGLRADVSAQA